MIRASSVLKPRGLRGEIKCAGFSPVPDVVFIAGREYPVRNHSNYDGATYLYLAGVESIDAAEKLRGKDIMVRRGDIKIADDEILATDMVGFAVVDAACKNIGTVRAVENYGAGEIVECNGANGEFAFPYLDEFVTETNMTTRTIVTTPHVVENPDTKN